MRAPGAMTVVFRDERSHDKAALQRDCRRARYGARRRTCDYKAIWCR